MDHPDPARPISSQHAGLLNRVGGLLRPVVKPRRPAAPEVGARAEAGVEELRERVDRLETVVEGLQDALYRQSVREDTRINEMRRRTEPDEMARALSEDARRRGL
jgi:hypothetical protein